MAKQHQKVIDRYIRRASPATTTDAWARIKPAWSPWQSRHTQDKSPQIVLARMNAANAKAWRAGRGGS